jgi:hypothetical protein
MAKRLAISVLSLVLITPLAHARLLYDSDVITLHSVPAERGAKNQHPVDVSEERLEALLSNIRVISDETDGKPLPLFPGSRALAAAKQLHTALRHIEPDQELLFVGYRKVGTFISSTRYATSARVFVENGQLNMILGQLDKLHAEFRDHDRALPKIGSRQVRVPLAGDIADSPGITKVASRNDWLSLDLDTAVVKRHTRRLGYGRAEDGAQRSTEQEQHPAPVAPREMSSDRRPIPQPEQPAAGAPQLEEQFEILRRLRTKDLITEEEYQNKKQELLDRL